MSSPTHRQTIVIQVCDHGQQRYETVGDWQWRGDDLLITVSDTGDWRSNIAIAIHELVEVSLCKDKGISEQAVDYYDIHSDSSDPGDEIDAPYRDQHCFATAVERMMIAAFGMAWKDHEILCNSLEYNKK